MLSLAFPPANVSLLVLIALAPWLASLRDTDSKGAKKSGYLFGFLYFLFQMYWLVPFVGRWTGSYLLAAIPWVICASIAGLYYMAAGWLTYRCWKLNWPWLIPIVWAGVEGFRSYVFGLAFPWGIVAEPLWMYPAFVQHAAWGTIFLVSATVVFLNVLVAMFVWPSKEHTPAPRTAFRYVSVVIVFIALSAMRYASPQQGVQHVYSVAQMGVDEAFGSDLTKRQDVKRAVDTVMALAIAGGAQTVVFPEGLADPSKTLPPPSPVPATPGVAVLFGGNHIVDGITYQTAYAYDGEWKYADKTRLVIFGEYVPFRDQLPFLQNFNLPSGDLQPAKELKTLEINGVKVGQMLCFEGVFPDLAERHGRNGAQVLAVMAIDDWYAGTPAHEQLTTSSIWRSIESGLPLLRATSMGTSMVTDSRGNRTSVAPTYGQTTALRAEVTVPTGSDAFPYRFAFIWVCWLAIGFVYFDRYFRSK
jgi:apolipoprotein N-acyltransferase